MECPMVDDKLKKLNALIKLSCDIAEVKDFDVLMEHILYSTRQFVNCDAGSIYIKQGDHLLFSYTQNDTLSQRLKPGQKLIYTTFSIPINNNSIAGYVATKGKILNIQDAYNLPESLPFRFDKSFHQSANYRTQSILTTPLKTRGEKIIGVLQLINCKDNDGRVVPFDPDLETYVSFLAMSAAGFLEQAQLTRAIILRMISMAELRDPKETGNHVNRVAGYALEIFEALAKKKNLPEKEVENKRGVLRMAAMLHDVGKVAISDIILKKPGRLDPDEYNVMKGHTVLGAKLFINPTSEFDEVARDVALNHHERYDGRGYPGHVDPFTGEPLIGMADSEGIPLPKKSEEIPLFGRIVALADVYDALSSQRIYKEAWDQEKVLTLIREESGKQFDPDVVEAFFSCLPSIQAIAQRYA